MEARPEATNYHRWVWKQVVEGTYGHTGFYLAAVCEESIVGVLPLFLINSRLFGRSLVSMPFSSYGGVLAETAEARDALLKKAIGIAREVRARHIELRQANATELAWSDVSNKVTMLVRLPSTVDALWNSLSTGMRNKIRSARKHGLSWRVDGIESLDCFYSIFAENMRNLGTPVYPRLWFENLCRLMPETVKILSIWDDGKAVGAGLVTQFRDGAEWPWSATTTESRRKYSAVFLYWALLEWAIGAGMRTVDLGRCTPGSGTYEFKRHWKCEAQPLHWYFWLAPGCAPPDMHADNPRFRLATRVWQRLPLPVANRLGPMIVRSIP